jgi:hypothetical protein
MRAGRDEKLTAHFIGSIVYVERGLGNVMQQVVDVNYPGRSATTILAGGSGE